MVKEQVGKYKDVFYNNKNASSDQELINSFASNGIYSKLDLERYQKFRRFGISPTIDPYNSITGTKEYLFFTKPDLHIVEPNTSTLNPELSNQVFFKELLSRYPHVISQLQNSSGIGDKGPFMALLSNTVNNTLDLESATASTIENPQTIYGTSYNYRGWAWNSDEKPAFSLEFKDTKYLEVYHLLKAYEEYERLKHLGIVTPPNIDLAPVVNGKCFSYYIRNKVLHDQFSIYKFIVEDDGQTIVYYAKWWGVFFKNVPRDAFSDLKAENGITYSVDFEAAFVDDMNPSILKDFNSLISKYVTENKIATTNLPIYNTATQSIDGTWAKLPFVMKVNKENNTTWTGPSGMNHKYELRWRI